MGWVESGGRAEAGDWRLEAGGWRLEAGGWRLEAGGGRLLWTHLRFYASRRQRHERRATRGACFERSREEIRPAAGQSCETKPIGGTAGWRPETGGGRLRWTHLHFYTSRPRRHEIRDTRYERRDTRYERRDTRYEIRGLPLGDRAKQSQFRRLRAANGGPGGYNGVIVGVWTGNG